MKEKRYSEKFKDRMIQRLVGPRKVSANALSKEVGVCQPTLSLWLRNAGRVAVGTNVGGVDLAHPFDPDAAPYEPTGGTVYLARL